MGDIALYLSGGGFRAALFHLGVIAALRQMECLRRVRSITAVSGGSIVAAHVALNWSRYVGQDGQFQQVTEELLAFAQRDVRGRILRRWLILGWLPPFFRVRQLIRHYDRLFKGARLDQLGGEGRPALSLVTTSMVTGDLCCFHERGFRRDCSNGQAREVAAAGLRVSVAVAASSAFPPMFPPVWVYEGQVADHSGNLVVAERFTDGGVFDNLGLRAGLPDAGLVVVSDASSGFRPLGNKSFSWVIPRTVRTTEILMERVASLETSALQAQGRKPVVAKISARLDRKLMLELVHGREPYEIQSPAVQEWIKTVRTDLDRFSDAEIYAIFRHGVEVGLSHVKEVSGKAFVHLDGPLWIPRAPGRNPVEAIKRARFRRVGIWNPKDGFCWLVVGLLVVAAASWIYRPWA